MSSSYYHEFLKESIGLGDDEVLKVTNGKTNRSVTHSDSQNETETLRIEELIISYVAHETKDLSSCIEVLVKCFDDCLCLTNHTFYRAVDNSKKRRLPSNQIGPSPDPQDGRYNVVGEKCIYLSDTIDFLYAELSHQCYICSSILVQRYDIPVDTLNIADLSSNNKGIHNSLALAFDMAERGRTSSGYLFEKELKNRGKSEYLISQLLSCLFKKYGWDGLYIPGVHGCDGYHYHNLAIFGEKVDKWKDWANGLCFPKNMNR